MFKGNSNRTAFIKALLAQSVDHRATNLKDVCSSPTVGKNFSSFVFCRFRHAPDRSAGPIQMKSSMKFIRGNRKMAAVLSSLY